MLILFQLEKLISKNYFLNQSAKEAFKAYVRAYDSHQLKTIFDISTLDLSKVALSCGFTVPPVVDLSKLFIYFHDFPINKWWTTFFNGFSNLLISSFAELAHKIRSRPEKRLGGGGYGRFKNANKEDKGRKFRQVNPRDFNKNRNFSR